MPDLPHAEPTRGGAGSEDAAGGPPTRSTADDQPAGGSGLGLPLVDRVAAQHGGVATAHNAQPHGFIVRITLPEDRTDNGTY